jgi:hypothetical protein
MNFSNCCINLENKLVRGWNFNKFLGITIVWPVIAQIVGWEKPDPIHKREQL